MLWILSLSSAGEAAEFNPRRDVDKEVICAEYRLTRARTIIGRSGKGCDYPPITAALREDAQWLQ